LTSTKLFYGTLTVAPPGEALLDGASFVEAAQTAPRYRLFSLDGFPVLVEDAAQGRSLGVQIWEVADDLWQRIVESEPPEMTAAQIELEDGRLVQTLVGPLAWLEDAGAVEVSEYGSWKAYREAESSPPASA
jgi:gamma-glutamylaminecyclotransferase